MNAFNRLPGAQPTPPGRERDVLRRLPQLLCYGTLTIALVPLGARWFPWIGSASEIELRITGIDIYAISVVVLLWTVVLTVAIAAFIVMVMKGPAYVADAYVLDDADTPDAARARPRA